jgi:predicted Rossmann-fold nucleotide-binding protein
MYDARNVINAKTPHVMVALRGGSGTLSEIALALRNNTPVIGLNAPQFKIAGDNDFSSVNTVEDVLQEIERILAKLKKNNC